MAKQRAATTLLDKTKNKIDKIGTKMLDNGMKPQGNKNRNVLE